MKKFLISAAALLVSAAPAAAATWSIYLNLFPAANPAVGGPPYGEFRVVGPIGNFNAVINCTNVQAAMENGSAGVAFMPFPGPTWGAFHAFCVQTSP